MNASGAQILAEMLAGYGVSHVFMVPAVLRRTSGFVYYVSVAGVTGVKEADAGMLFRGIRHRFRKTHQPVRHDHGPRSAT